MKQIHRYRLDLSKIDGNGEFVCPRCGTMISPDDDTEEAYSILEPKVNSQGLEELVIHCNTRAHQNGVTVSICGEGPSNLPDFAEFLVQCGIDREQDRTFE